MEAMTIGVLYLALLLLHELINVLIEAIVAAGGILLVVSVAYGVYDRIKGRRKDRGEQ